MLSIDDLFRGRHFDREIIILWVRVRWYLRFKLRYRDLVEMMTELGSTAARRRPDRHLGCGRGA
jgi:transposase-like protein